jgi:hypothetical protein
LWVWQTLIAGVLALIAAVGTIWATRRAAAEQVGAAQRQTDAMRTSERRRIAREAYAFYAMMAAAMESVLDDAKEARKIAATAASAVGSSPIGYAARTQVKKPGFSELLVACLRYGGQRVTPGFLRLDRAIDDFGSAPKVFASPMGGKSELVGAVEGLNEELGHIEALAQALRDEVGPGIERCTALLAETQESDFP